MISKDPLFPHHNSSLICSLCHLRKEMSTFSKVLKPIINRETHNELTARVLYHPQAITTTWKSIFRSWFRLEIRERKICRGQNICRKLSANRPIMKIILRRKNRIEFQTSCGRLVLTRRMG